jgi:hypothetical protein
MADNIVLNPGTGGDTVAAKDIGGIKHPIHFSLAQPKTVKVDVTRPADTAVYAVADAIANSTSAPTSGGFTIAGAARASGGSCLITDVMVASSNPPATRLSGEIWIFDQSVTAINDNAVFGVTDAEIKNCIAIIPFSLFNAGNNNIAHVYGLSVLATCVGSADLRFLLRTRNAYTPASAEVLSFTFKLLQLD